MPSLERKLSRAAVIGYGRYGRIHARKYRRLPDVDLCGIADTSAAHRVAAATECPGVPVFADVDELLAHVQPDMASVTVPATAHFAIARRLLAAGVHALVEKPMASRRDDAIELMHLSRRWARVLQPGHVERFNSALAELRASVPAPRHVETRRLIPWTGRGADVDVVLDLMIHDIDMLLEIVDAPITGIEARGMKLFSGHWDVASARVSFSNGCTANLTASRASLPRSERRVHVFSRTACALADLEDGRMLVHRRDAAGAVSTRECACCHEDPLAVEIAAFVRAVREGREPVVTAEDGCRAVDVAVRIAEAMESDGDVLANVESPMTDSDRAIAWLTQSPLH